jgi:lipoprotein-releasing system ATP-binding protein
MAEAMISIRRLVKSYWLEEKLIPVLRGIDLRIAHGEMISIIGASGAGKSTFLHVVGTLDSPDEGELLFDGTNLASLSPANLAEMRNRSIGFVFQFHHLLPEFNAVENVMLPALIARSSRADARERAHKILQEVGMGHRLDHRPGELSGGEQQRVALARALVMNPPLLLADEVTGNLDDATAQGIHELLFELNRRHRVTLILVTHNRTLAASMPRRLLLENGKFVELS